MFLKKIEIIVDFKRKNKENSNQRWSTKYILKV